ncbi:MAG: polyprenyl synthetase family protein [Clostridiales bacterium]|nr:polyprenyl synthetase family protein [Clostridiales bacterium]
MTGEEYREISRKYKVLVENELDRIRNCEALSIQPKLRDAMFYSLEAGGKRIRPCLLLAVCEQFGGDVEKALPFACGLEMIHTYSLIHDDLPCMDDDDMRRGRPSNHKVFGEAMAVLAGDGLLSYAFETMLNAAVKNGDTGSLLTAGEIARLAGAAGMVTGQAADIEFENSENKTEAMLAFIHRHKTADMLEAAVVSGALIAGADGGDIEKLRRYSEKMGLLFQITDDLLDYTGDPALMGKTLHKDEAQGKLTYVTLLGLEGAKEAAKATAEEAKAQLEGLRDPGFLAAVIDNMLERSN